jgi:alpha 1,4-glycosyltransferase
MSSFATFWAGNSISPYELACLKSFGLHGYEVELFTYNELSDLPEGVHRQDAREILGREYMDSFILNGRPSLAHFADFFRYALLSRTSFIWIDSDLLMLRAFDRPLPNTILATDHKGDILNGFIRIDHNDPRLRELLETTRSLAGKELGRWGATGPLLVTRLFRSTNPPQQSFGPDQIYPIRHYDFWKMFLPEHADECESLCSGAYTVHLWNNIISRLGVWKSFAPPVGSFLHSRFAKHGTLPYFRDTYPLPVMQQMIENWRLRQSGGDIGIVTLSRQLIPSLLRTAGHYGLLRAPRRLPLANLADGSRIHEVRHP